MESLERVNTQRIRQRERGGDVWVATSTRGGSSWLLIGFDSHPKTPPPARAFRSSSPRCVSPRGGERGIVREIKNKPLMSKQGEDSINTSDFAVCRGASEAWEGAARGELQGAS